MKTLKIFLTTLFTIAIFHFVNASSNKTTKTVSINNYATTDTFKVYGECGMCKSRIEKAARTIDGVQTAVWNVDTKILTVTYDNTKNEVIENLQKKMAAVGHDTEKYRATDAAYNGLPKCCHYDRKAVAQQ
ncbi:MAG: cation transporter [Bacteroidetes bacterium]|nr:cation transporter [Bacteroidota bacterium]MBS1591886.1 cation transporter [Bacteroidota bacterium]